MFHLTYEYVLNEYKFGGKNEAKFSTPLKQCMHVWLRKLQGEKSVAQVVDTG